MLEDRAKLSLDELLNIRAPSTYLIKVEGDSMEGGGHLLWRSADRRQRTPR
jgi:SOS-response transcriptional repressor LexA